MVKCTKRRIGMKTAVWTPALAVCCLTLLLPTQKAAGQVRAKPVTKSAFGSPDIAIPFVLVRGIPAVELTVNRHKVVFLVDSGSERTLLNAADADFLDLHRPKKKPVGSMLSVG